MIEDLEKKSRDAWEYLKDRFSNPLFYSFCISWIVFNWDVPLAIIFYDNEMLANECYGSYKDFILDRDADIYQLLIWPLLSAISYVLLSPGLREGIKMLNNWVVKKTSKTNLDLVGETSVPMDSYLGLRAALKERMDQLSKLIVEESKTTKSLETERNLTSNLRTQVETLDSEIKKLDKDKKSLNESVRTSSEANDSLNQTIRELHNLNDTQKVIELIAGDWINDHFIGNHKGKEALTIENDGKYFASINGVRTHLATITYASIDHSREEITFVKTLTPPFAYKKPNNEFPGRGINLVNRLKYSGTDVISTMEGAEDQDIKIRYSRMGNFRPNKTTNKLLLDSLELSF